MLEPLGIEETNGEYIFFFEYSKLQEVRSELNDRLYLIESVEFDLGSMTQAPSGTFRLSSRLRYRIVDSCQTKKRWAPEVVILKGSAFGTGEHPTTRRMLWILERSKKYGSCLDFGAGTGILGLTFEALYGGQVYFVENDPLAVKNLATNLKLNFSKGFVVALRDVPVVDLIVANVYLSTILNNLPVLLSKRPKLLVFSGLREQDDLSLLENEVKVRRIFIDQGWVSCIATPKYVR